MSEYKSVAETLRYVADRLTAKDAKKMALSDLCILVGQAMAASRTLGDYAKKATDKAWDRACVAQDRAEADKAEINSLMMELSADLS